MHTIAFHIKVSCASCGGKSYEKVASCTRENRNFFYTAIRSSSGSDTRNWRNWQNCSSVFSHISSRSIVGEEKQNLYSSNIAKIQKLSASRSPRVRMQHFQLRKIFAVFRSFPVDLLIMHQHPTDFPIVFLIIKRASGGINFMQCCSTRAHFHVCSAIANSRSLHLIEIVNVANFNSRTFHATEIDIAFSNLICIDDPRDSAVKSSYEWVVPTDQPTKHEIRHTNDATIIYLEWSWMLCVDEIIASLELANCDVVFHSWAFCQIRSRFVERCGHQRHGQMRPLKLHRKAVGVPKTTLLLPFEVNRCEWICFRAAARCAQLKLMTI